MAEMSIAKFLLVLGMVVGVHQASTNCKNCVNLGKEERAMFRSHSDACLSWSHATPAQVMSLCRGEPADAPELRAHVYCVLLRCKLIGKEGKLHKSAVLAKIAQRADGKNITKVLESCADSQSGNTPEDLAWSLFRCGYDKKAMLFEYMPPASDHMPPASDHMPPASDHMPPASDHMPPASDHMPPASDHMPPASGHMPPASELHSETTTVAPQL